MARRTLLSIDMAVAAISARPSKPCLDYSRDIELRGMTSVNPSIQVRPKQSSPFHLLPPELRITIFEFVVISDSYISWQGGFSGDEKAQSQDSNHFIFNSTSTYLPARYNIAAALLVNRGMYREAAPIFYGCNRF